MDMKRFFLYAIAIAALALAGCGGGGGGTAMMPGDGDGDTGMPMPMPMPDPDPEEPMVDHDAVIGGIVNPSIAGDPSTARDTQTSNRPGNASDDSELVMARQGANDTIVEGVAKGTSTGFRVGATDYLNNIEMMGPADDRKPVPKQFMPVDGSETTLGQFDGMVHEKTVKKITDTIAVYTNAEEAGELSYDVYYGVEDRPGVTDDAAVEADTPPVGQLDINETSVKDNSKLFYSTEFPGGDRQTFTFTDKDDTATVDERMFDGMFNGVAGRYGCTEDGDIACTATSDKDGNLVKLTGEWNFTPSADDLTEVMIAGVDHDTDYLTFGYWVRATEKENGSTAYGVGTFWAGADTFSDQAIANLDGKATYSGSAAGMYGQKMLNPDGSVASATSGHFTADAALTAYFGQKAVSDTDTTGTISPNLLATISGTISSFNDGGTDLGWTLGLDKASFGTSGQPDAVMWEDATTTGNAGVTKGDWAGGFFGNPATDATPTDNYPTGVAGEFTGHFNNGHVIGAFGATVD
jgi:hypothetical protein